MKIRTHDRVTEVEFDEQSYKVGSIDVERLLKALRAYEEERGDKVVSIAASYALEEDSREATGEDILHYTELSGGRAVYEVDASGLITSITASIPAAHFEYDSHEISEVLESLQAAGPTPAKLIGDLAQTSVGLTGAEVQVLGLNDWTIDWKRKTADATTTDDDTYESSLGSTASWTVKAKYMFIDGDSSQSTYLLATITTPQTPQPWNLFPTVALGRSAFSGLAYVDGLTIASGMGKVVATDVSLKGTGPLKVATQIAPVANPATGTGVTAET